MATLLVVPYPAGCNVTEPLWMQVTLYWGLLSTLHTSTHLVPGSECSSRPPRVAPAAQGWLVVTEAPCCAGVLEPEAGMPGSAGTAWGVQSMKVRALGIEDMGRLSSWTAGCHVLLPQAACFASPGGFYPERGRH